jgi:acyl carrier protein
MTYDALIRELAAMVATASSMPTRPVPLEPSLRLREDAGMESLGFIDLIVSIEERYGIVLDPVANDFEIGLRTLGGLTDLVMALTERESE